jgi:hypothetical protein
MMFEYEKIEPVLPGNHIEGWQKIRKKQWKYVKKALGGCLGLHNDHIARYKSGVYLLEDPNFDVEGSVRSPFPNPTDHPGHWGPCPLGGFFICSDQSQKAWDDIWHTHSATTNGDAFGGLRDRFLQYVPHGYGPDENNQDPFGTFGGLEQRMLPYLIQSDVYTDELFQMGRFEYRKVPWKSAFLTFRHIFSQITTAVDSDYWVSPYFYAQWLHGLYVSCFEYDLDSHPDLNISNMYLYCQRLMNVLDSNADETFHPNHLKAARLLITILEDEGTPQWLRKIWANVRDGKVSA